MSGPEERAYEDVPAGSVTAVCQTCDGDGWVWQARAAAVGERSVSIAKREACAVCGGSGRVDTASGPGARLRSWERARGPWDDW